jgi:RNase H-fold protein (predicted Holliday junction resolvase)
VAVEYIDERLSSHEAAALCRGGHQELDAMAARLILETWLNTPRPVPSGTQ